jgi:hypothetical protein
MDEDMGLRGDEGKNYWLRKKVVKVRLDMVLTRGRKRYKNI